MSEAPPHAMPGLQTFRADAAAVDAHLKTFDTLDFDVYSHQRWDRLKESHAPDIVVHYPDGSMTRGLDAHIAALKPMFVFAPDTHIQVHPVKFGSGPWTAVIGVIEGDFTQPMALGQGKTLAPTGRHFKLQMATIGHWTSAGVMDEEFLFWDNAALMAQITGS
ncbi:MAG: ester cyclase [Alphaproteobacteria bacterium]|nr:ester cyclase [Alphaproteobacteria bacterium]